MGEVEDRLFGAAYAAIVLGKHSRRTGHLESAPMAAAAERIDRTGRWRSPKLPVVVEAVAEYVKWAETLDETESGCWVGLGTPGGCLAGIGYHWRIECPSQEAKGFRIPSIGPRSAH